MNIQKGDFVHYTEWHVRSRYTTGDRSQWGNPLLIADSGTVTDVMDYWSPPAVEIDGTKFRKLDCCTVLIRPFNGGADE